MFKKGSLKGPKNYVYWKPFEISDGKGRKTLSEPVPLPLKRAGERIYKGEIDNNAKIVIGRDRDPFGKGKRKKKEFKDFQKSLHRESEVSGYSDYMGAGAIDIVVGSAAPYPVDMSSIDGSSDRPHNYPPLYCTEPVNSLRGKQLIVNSPDETGDPPVLGPTHPGVVMDAARIYITQMGDIDDYFDLPSVPVLNKGDTIDNFPSSGIVMKADRLRMHSRRNIYIVAGGDGESGIDSNGYTIKERSGVHIIAGNGRLGKQQPMVLGDNLVHCLKGMYELIQDLHEHVDKILKEQSAYNKVIACRIFVNGAGPSVPDPVGKIAGLVHTLGEISSTLNGFFSKFVNIPLSNEQNFCGPQAFDYILSRYNTVN